MYAYSLYLKIWLNATTFETYSSKPLAVDHTPPSIRRGRYIKDSNIFCQLDFDVIDWTENITACWDGVFSEQQSTITYYNVSLGTSVKGNDIVQVSNVGLSTNFTVTRVRLEPGIKYFFTVTAVNILGLNSQKSSDGFLIDTDNPIHGVVYNTGRFMDSSFQGEADSLNISWTGFVDHYSGIQSYYVALAEVNETLNQGDFVNVGLQTTYSFRNLILQHGHTYISYVKAVDSVKHYSNVSATPAITIDTTPPAGFYCRNYNEIMRDTFMVERVRLIEFPYSFRKDGLYRAIGYLESGVNDFRVTIQSGYLHFSLPIVTNHNGSIYFEYDFSPSESLNETLYINIFGKNATVYMTLFECDAKVQSNENVVRVSQLVGSEIAVSVNVEDKESKIKQVLLGVGTYPNSFQIVPLHQVHCVNIHLLNIDGVSHSTPLFVTAIVDNHAGLRSTFSSIPIVVDRTGPVISLLEFNTISFLDTAANGTVETTVNISWSAMDNESGLKSCYVGIGNTVNDNNVLKATYAPGTMFTTIMLNLAHGTRMIANIRCVNKVEIASAMSSSTQYVLYSKPDMNSVYLNVIADNEMSTDCNMKHVFSEGPVSIAPTASPSCPLYLQTNDSSIKLEWSGRTDKLYIERFEFKVAKNENETIIDWTSCGLYRMIDVAGLSLQSNQMYTCSVRGIDIRSGRSDPLTALVKPRWFVPSLTDEAITASFSNKTVTLNWTDVFAMTSNNAFLFDVSVGTRKGYNDVIDIKKTRDAFVTFRPPENSILGPVGNELFINVVCKDMLGLFTVYETAIAVL
ncbi:uncharacterized protein LOC128203377 [Mya arenaria]|uniref:uncharacterized protein LOC128203377 n=1 Tax=Mya arenaria TaxID=6604 RepID=UPI0022E28EC6|nr:uncharacterized protein LOC128203377 [Mya arenaria]